MMKTFTLTILLTLLAATAAAQGVKQHAFTTNTVSTTTNIVRSIVGMSNFMTGNFTYKTNQNQMVPDFSMPVQLMTTNANFTFLTPIGVDTTKTEMQTTAIYVTNSAGNSTLTVTLPANVTGVGSMYVTQLTRFTWETYAQKFTNCFSVPVR